MQTNLFHNFAWYLYEYFSFIDPQYKKIVTALDNFIIYHENKVYHFILVKCTYKNCLKKICKLDMNIFIIFYEKKLFLILCTQRKYILFEFETAILYNCYNIFYSSTENFRRQISYCNLQYEYLQQHIEIVEKNMVT